MTDLNKEILEIVANLVYTANTQLPGHVLNAICAAEQLEENNLPHFVLNILKENARIAEKTGLPICQDTGIDVFFVELGRNLAITDDILSLINRGVAKATKEGWLRASVCDPLTRQNTRDNTPAIVHVTPIPQDDYLSITVLPKGCGSENMSAVFMLPPSAGINGIVTAVCEQVKKAGPNSCPPGIIGVGIGGDLEQAAILAKKALLRPIGQRHARENVAELEAKLLQEINKSGIGPQGLGGRTTTLHVAIDVFPCHIASLPVAVNIQCHAARSKTAVWQKGTWSINGRQLTASSANEFLSMGNTQDLIHAQQPKPCTPWNIELSFKRIQLPFSTTLLQKLRSGDLVLLSGVLYTGRDQTHKRLVELIAEGEKLPIDLNGQLIYYVGPSPAPPGLVIGSAGPTTSYRMDAYTPQLLKLGLAATMGKGRRSLAVREAMKDADAIYLATIGGAGAYISRCIRKCECVAFEELGTEAMYRMEVQDLPAIVINDTTGADFYEIITHS